jgi:hypothetical protein
MADKVSDKFIEMQNSSNFKELNCLKSPRKGRIIKGSNWNAFNRQSLGSIPRKIENILFKDKSEQSIKAFLSQKVRFEDFNKIESVKYSYPGPGKYDDELQVTGTNGMSRPGTFS